MPDIKNNTTSLEELLQAVNNLPESSGSEDVSSMFETCNIRIITGGDMGGTEYCSFILYTTIENNVLTNKIISTYDGEVFTFLGRVDGAFKYEGTISCVVGTTIYGFNPSFIPIYGPYRTSDNITTVLGNDDIAICTVDSVADGYITFGWFEPQ